ncbi:hypothetical protein CEUSTIGMA_g4824.t1 [Chlamydomonas eustigma]|uniref:RRM domain-containing protein n=1 Tax=Chlamydomonas eustigma TaxID=1157962 RepID=A0A250X2T0_9CHLO|nr:hypothetical protein CEUSTIGMA_g4824.t1 [Chlamydomonas eustigma]|eukprot:GAX77378.1 hypothetical protein CEUSTIGMA_g4824.t1 [Chlamydomonas eustigma]
MEFHDFSTLYAKPFSKHATESKIIELFAPYGRVINVELRKDDSGAFRGSIFVTFADASCAKAAIKNPPLQLGSSIERLSVMLKPDYEKKVFSVSGPGSSKGKKKSLDKISASHQSHGKDKHRSEGNHSKRSRSSVNAATDYEFGYQPHLTPIALKSNLSTTTTTWGDQSPVAGHINGIHAAGHSVMHWKGLAEDRERRVKELEDQVKIEREARENGTQKVNQAMSRLEEAQSRERAAASKLLSKEAELGCLKGEVSSLRSSMAARLDQLHIQYKARVHDLEVHLQQLKEENGTLKQRLQKLSSAGPITNAVRGSLEEVNEAYN